MKTKKNVKTVNFICNECKKESGDMPEVDSDNFKGGNVFPYDSGWIYIYNLEMKILGEKISLKDVHICSKTCFTKHLKKLIDKKKEEKNVNNKNKHRTSTK